MIFVRNAFGERFEVPPGYLNTASIGVPPQRAGAAVAEAVRGWCTGAAQPADFDGDVHCARAAFGRLVGVAPEQVTAGVTVSQLVGLVAASLPGGARVLAARGDFASTRFPFHAQTERGIVVDEVELAELPAALEAEPCDLVAVSVVQSADGRVVDLDALREAAARTGTAVLLDATQAAGWLPLSLDWADYVVATGYKWLMCPRGAAWMAVRPDRLDALVPHAANWCAGQDPWASLYDTPMRLATDARRLDLSPVWLAQRGAAAVLPWLAGLDLTEVHRHCTGLADTFRAEWGLPPTGSAIVSVPMTDPTAAVHRLAEAGVTATVRAGALRLSFHLYNAEDDVETVLRALHG